MNDSTEIPPQLYYQYLDKEGIIDQWLLVNTPLPTLSVLMAYMTFVLYLGPHAMKNRQAFKLQRFMIIYNTVQVIYNFGIIYMVMSSYEAVTYLYNHSCHADDPNKTFHIRYLFHVSTWHYLCSKIVDLLDTIIMVLRKKQSHVTYLHVYHHVSMVFFTWYTMKYVKAQQATPMILVNSFVHVIMYTYYLLTCFGPEVQKYLWWKRYLTSIQMTQFSLAISYLAYLHMYECNVSQAFNFIWIANVPIISTQFAALLVFLFYLYFNGCGVPHTFNVIWAINLSIFIVLFTNFYVQNYIVKLRNSKQRSE